MDRLSRLDRLSRMGRDAGTWARRRGAPSGPIPHGPITHALALDGLTQWGVATWDAPIAGQDEGLSVVYEMVHTATPSTYKVPLRLLQTSGDQSQLGIDAPAGASGGWVGAYSRPTGGGGTTATTTLTPPAADSAGYRLGVVSVVPSGSGRLVTMRARGPAGTAVLTATHGSAGIDPTMRRLIFASSTTDGAFITPGLVARIAVFVGQITADDGALLYGPVDWRYALEGRTPVGYWLPQDGVDVGSTLVVPDLMGGPGLVWTASARADLSATVPTRVAA